MSKKIIQCGKPEYIAEQMTSRNAGGTRMGTTLDIPQKSLTLSREGFVYRGSKLYNLIPESLRKEMKISIFKKEAKNWIKVHIPVKP